MTKKADKQFNFTKAQLKELAELAASGVSEESLAFIFDCPDKRFKWLLLNDKDVHRAVYVSRARTNASVAAALVESARDGDVRAQQFYLKNRDRSWSDKSPEERKADKDALSQPKLVISLSQDED